MNRLRMLLIFVETLPNQLLQWIFKKPNSCLEITLKDIFFDQQHVSSRSLFRLQSSHPQSPGESSNTLFGYSSVYNTKKPLFGTFKTNSQSLNVQIRTMNDSFRDPSRLYLFQQYLQMFDTSYSRKLKTLCRDFLCMYIASICIWLANFNQFDNLYVPNLIIKLMLYICWGCDKLRPSSGGWWFSEIF